MPEQPVLLCVRTTRIGAIPKSKQSICSGCGQRVWVSAPAIHLIGQYRVACEVCVPVRRAAA